MNNHSVASRIVARPRRRFSETQINQFLDEFQRSGLSAAAFSRQRGLCYSVFCRWRKRREVGPHRRSAPRFQPLPLSELLGRSWAAEIALPEGVALRLQDRVSSAWVRELLYALRRSC